MLDQNLVGFVHDPRRPEAAELVAFLVKTLGLQQTSWVASSTELDVSGESLAETSVVITAGGDGTILRVVQLAAPYSVPVLGINMGRVGFMTEVAADEAAEKMPFYLSGRARVEERMMLQASVTSRAGGGPHLTFHALNDAVVSRGAIPRLLDIQVVVDGAPLATHRADGVISATATGSTAYALSAGGPVVYPEARVLLIQPLASHMSLQTGLIIPGDSVVELVVAGEHEAVLSVDGITDTTLGSDDRVAIKCSPHVARFLRADPPAAFYSSLTQRLGVR